MSNWAENISITTLYTNLVNLFKTRDDELAVGLDPARVTITNPVTYSVRWNSASNKWQVYNGSSWGDLSANYAINISGNAANITGVAAAANGGTGQSAYSVGDLLYASGATALSKLAAVAVGNAFISGGVGAAPAWGKISLTTHISDTLALGNGGTGATDAAGARTALGLGTAATLNVGTGANNILQLNGSSQIPAVDASLVTGAKWQGSSKTVSTSGPSGGADGDIWLEREA